MESGSNYARSAESILAQVNSSIGKLGDVQGLGDAHQLFSSAEEALQAMQMADVDGHDVAIQEAWKRLKAAHNQAVSRLGTQ